MAVLSTLSSSVKAARHTAAQAVSAMAFIDLPANQWPELIQGLVSNVTNAPNAYVKQSSLEALGYICEEIEPDVLAPQSNLILTAVVQGMQKAEPDEDVRLAATRALMNALEFVRTNFESEVERNYIMQTVCETVTAESKELRCAAFECCVRVVELYYEKLAPYMQALYQLTLVAIQKATRDPEEDEAGQQAIEFWSTICDEELEIMEEAQDAQEFNRQPERNNQNFIRGALPYLVPLLLEALVKQTEDDDEEEWNVAMAAASCLARVALTVEDEVVQHVMPFIEKYITSSDWRRREAATSAFASILEGPSQQVMQPYMAQAIDLLINMMRDQSTQCKDTAAWAIGRVCEHQIASISAQQWRQMTHAPRGPDSEPQGVLLAGLWDHPRVAANVCKALHSLASHCENTRNEPTNVLSPHFVDLAKALLECTDRGDADENNLRTSAYEALNMTLTNAAMDTLPHIEQLLPVIASRLQASFSMQIVSNDDKEALNDLQGLLCGSLQVVPPLPPPPAQPPPPAWPPTPLLCSLPPRSAPKIPPPTRMRPPLPLAGPDLLPRPPPALPLRLGHLHDTLRVSSVNDSASLSYPLVLRYPVLTFSHPVSYCLLLLCVTLFTPAGGNAEVGRPRAPLRGPADGALPQGLRLQERHPPRGGAHGRGRRGKR
jgi:importin subunit beta-1